MLLVAIKLDYLIKNNKNNLKINEGCKNMNEMENITRRYNWNHKNSIIIYNLKSKIFLVFPKMFDLNILILYPIRIVSLIK